MWDFIIYGLIVVNIVVLLLLLTREIKLGRACTTNASLPSPSNMPASGGTPQGIEHSTVLTPGPPLISDMNGETQFSTQKPLPAAGSLLFSLLFLTMGAAILGWGIHLTSQDLTSRTWPTAAGKIISSTVTESRDSEDHPIYQAEVHYFYSVNGVTYANNKVSFVSASSSDRSFSNRIVARYPAGKIAQVSYDPAQPKTAVLEPVLYTSFLLFYGIGGVFILTSLLFLYLAGRRRFNERPRF
jgi:hypothetical protein